MRKSSVPAIFLALAVAAGCTFSSPPTTVTLRLAGPAFKDFACVGVVVTGEGIPSLSKQDAENAWEKIRDGSTCAYPGITTATKAIPTSGNVSFAIRVPSGRSRTFQVVGIQTTEGCPGDSVGELLMQSRRGALPKAITAIYELGRHSQNVFHPTIIPIVNTYDSTKAGNILECQPKDPAGGTTFAAKVPSISLFVGDQHPLEIVNGSGNYSFTISGTAGALTATPPVFNAIQIGVSTVTITDSATGKTAQAVYTVDTPTNLASSFRYRYTAQSFNTLPDGQIVTGGAPWPNTLSFSDDLALASGVGTVTFRKGAGPNGLPAVEIGIGAKFAKTATDPVTSVHGLYAVVRRLNPAAAKVFAIFGGGAACQTITSTCTALEFFHPSGLSAGFIAKSPTFAANPAMQVNTTGLNDWILMGGEFNFPTASSLVYGGGISLPAPASLGSFNITAGTIILGSGDTTAGATATMQIAEIAVVDIIVDSAVVLNFYRAKYGLP